MMRVNPEQLEIALNAIVRVRVDYARAFRAFAVDPTPENRYALGKARRALDHAEQSALMWVSNPGVVDDATASTIRRLVDPEPRRTPPPWADND